MKNQQRSVRVWSERLRLGALNADELIRIGLISVIIGLFFITFHLLGNTVENINSRSVFLWMTARWRDTISFGADYSHGYFIPFVSLFIIWFKRKEIFSVERRVDWRGLVVIIVALASHWLGAKVQQTRISLISLVMLLWGVPFYLFGWEMAKKLIFPCAYLLFCVPLNFLDVIAFPLRMLSTTIATGIINLIGISAIQEGTSICSAVEGGFRFNVADPCSGLRSLLALTALTAVYAYFTQKTLVKKWILFLSAIPLAVIGNIVRIVTIAVVSESVGNKIGTGLYHDYSTYIMFFASISIMVMFGTLLNHDFNKRF